jgi:hypothetical protein
MIPGYTAEASVGNPRISYRRGRGAGSSSGLRLAQSEVFCGVCALGGFGCGSICHPCGPFGWFDCCDSVCTQAAMTAAPGH